MVLGVGKGVLFREVSSFQRLKCMQEWYILGVGKGVLFREVSSFQRLKCMQEWYILGVEKVSCLERCPHFRGCKSGIYLGWKRCPV